ncbi:transposable element Tcb2 transposase [Trichonephila clavipes]|nr:transposable element Tcb2 transposase [Trichonephila clavipes]
MHKTHLNVEPRVRSRNAYRHVSDLDKGRIVAYIHCGLSYRRIAARIGQDPMTVSTIWNRWVDDGITECRTGSQRFHIICSRKDRRVARQLGRSGCVERRCWDQWIQEMPFTQRPSSRCPRPASRQEDHHIWCRARGNWTAAERNQVVFSDESRFNLSSNGNRVRVWKPCGKLLNAAFALQRQTVPTAGVIVVDAIADNTWSP